MINKLQIKKLAKDLYAWGEKKDHKAIGDMSNHITELFLKKGATRQLKELITTLEKIDETKNGVMRVSITSAFKLSDTVEQKILATIGTKDAVVTHAIKPELLGGVEIRFNDKLINISLKHQLNNLL